jgi:hypothetical protein
VEPRRRWLTRRNLLLGLAAIVVLNSALAWRHGVDAMLNYLIPAVLQITVWGGVFWAAARYNRKHFPRPGTAGTKACMGCKYPLEDVMERCPECGRPTRPIVVKGFET